MTAAPPHEFASLGLDADTFVRAGTKNWRGACPRCGGHRRFVLFTDKPFPKWNFFCEGCDIKGFADQLNTSLRQPISDEKKREWAQRNAAELAARAKYRAEKLAEFSTVELWAELAARMNAEQRAWWERQGVPIEWQKHLKIGYVPQKNYIGQDGASHTSPAYALPFFHTGFEFVTMQYRLNDVSNPSERYRFEKGLGTAYYQTTPEKQIGPEVIICEGAKKAIVTTVNTPDNFTVLGVPSKGDFGGVADAVKDCPRVFVLLDPDAGLKARKLAAEIGPHARVVDMPVKVDDGLVLHGMSQAQVLAYLRNARPL